MKILSILRKLIYKKKIKSFQEYIAISKNTVIDDSFKLDLRNPKKEKKYLCIGQNSVISGSYIFEKESGHIYIGDRVHIGNSIFISINEIIIEDDVTIAWNCLFYDHNSHSTDWQLRSKDTLQEYSDLQQSGNPILNKNWKVVKSAPIKICGKAWIGTGCIILKGVTVGEGAIVAAGSVVVNDVEAWTLVGGNPARFIKKLIN